MSCNINNPTINHSNHYNSNKHLSPKEGEQIVQEQQYDNEEVSEALEELESRWKDLLSAVEEKKLRLNEAYEVGGGG